jgi:hypothetical protein
MLTTLKTRDGIYTTDLVSKINHMMEHFIPEDSVSSNRVHHKCIRQKTLEPLHKVDDEEFTKQKILGHWKSLIQAKHREKMA